MTRVTTEGLPRESSQEYRDRIELSLPEVSSQIHYLLMFD